MAAELLRKYGLGVLIGWPLGVLMGDGGSSRGLTSPIESQSIS